MSKQKVRWVTTQNVSKQIGSKYKMSKKKVNNQLWLSKK